MLSDSKIEPFWKVQFVTIKLMFWNKQFYVFYFNCMKLQVVFTTVALHTESQVKPESSLSSKVKGQSGDV